MISANAINDTEVVTEIAVRCAVIARVSLDRQSESVDNQVSLLREFVRSRELGVIPDDCIYEDVGVSASKFSIWQRPAMKRLLLDANTGKFQIILFKGISRFARNTQEALDVLDRLKAKGLRVISYEENYDSEKENSNFMFTMHAAIAEYEAEKIGIRVRLGNKEKSRSGKWVGEPPFGYLLKDRKLVVDESVRHVIQTIFNLYVKEGFGVFKVGQYLNLNSWFTKSGARWSRKTIANVLRNEAYIGNIVYNKTKLNRVRDYDSAIEGKKKWVRKANAEEEWIVANNAHEAIIERELFMKAREKLNIAGNPKRAANDARNAPNAQHPLTGILYCRKCGVNMVCQKRTVGGKVYRYYICKTYHKYGRTYCDQANVNAALLEPYVAEMLTIQLNEVANRQLLTNQITMKDAEAERLERELTELVRKSEKINRDTADLFLQRGNFIDGQYEHLQKRLKDDAIGLQERKKDIEKQLNEKINEETVSHEIMRNITEFLNVDRADTKKMRRLFGYFLDRIDVEGSHVDIFYRFDK